MRSKQASSYAFRRGYLDAAVEIVGLIHARFYGDVALRSWEAAVAYRRSRSTNVRCELLHGRALAFSDAVFVQSTKPNTPPSDYVSWLNEIFAWLDAPSDEPRPALGWLKRVPHSRRCPR
jgi:hypothetical protein